MNKEIYQSIYQHQIRLARQVNQNLSSLINMDHYSLQLNKLNLFQDIQETLQNIDLSLYTTIPFDTEKYSNENDHAKLKFLDELNEFVMSIQKKYENA